MNIFALLATFTFSFGGPPTTYVLDTGTGGCQHLIISNTLAAMTLNYHIFDYDLNGVIIHHHGNYEGFKDLFRVTPPEGWWVDQEEVLLEDEESAEFFICPNVGV